MREGKKTDIPKKARPRKEVKKSTNPDRLSTEYTITETLSMLGFPDTDEGREGLRNLLALHDVSEQERSVANPRGGVNHYYPKQMVNELQAVVRVNVERRHWDSVNLELAFANVKEVGE